MSAFSPRDLLSSSPREPLRSAWKYVFVPFNSFALISPIIAANGRMSPRHNAAAYHGPAAAAPGAPFSPQPPPSRLARPRRPGDSAIGFAGGDKIVAERRAGGGGGGGGGWGGGGLLSGRLSRCHGKARGEWFSVASDFQYLFSIRPPLISGSKSNM